MLELPIFRARIIGLPRFVDMLLYYYNKNQIARGGAKEPGGGGGPLQVGGPYGGVWTPPYRMREQGCKPCPFVARLSPTGGLQAAPTIERKLARVSPDCLMIAVLRVIRIFRRFVGRGLDPAAGTFRQGRRSR